MSDRIESRLAQEDWDLHQQHIETLGYAHIADFLSEVNCQVLQNCYHQPELFRSRVIMERHGFGKGEYQYFQYPLPELVQSLRAALYPHLSVIANHWQNLWGKPAFWPGRHEHLLKICAQSGQCKPTPLILSYGPGDFNCLHQDRYGEIHFPLQAVILLSQPERDFQGGQFTLVENRPRMQSRCETPPLRQGSLLLFPVAEKPRKTARGYSKSTLRHGVSTLLSGQRKTLGIIFHDAR